MRALSSYAVTVKKELNRECGIAIASQQARRNLWQMTNEKRK